MCLICVEFDKLSLIEAKRNFGEMTDLDPKHAEEVRKKIREREDLEFTRRIERQWGFSKKIP